MQTYSQIGRKSPWSCCPYYNCCFIKTQFIFKILFPVHFYINRRRYHILIFYFRFSQCCFSGRRPVNRFQSFINISVIVYFLKYSQLLGFIFRYQSNVRIFPFTHNTQSYKFRFLFFHPFQSVFTAFFSDLYRRHSFYFISKSLGYFQLNRKTMCIPSRYIRCIIASESFISHYNIF